MNALFALALGFILVLGAGPVLIPQLHRLKFGQSIREEGPQSHQAKSGTPTMGGLMIILGLVLATLVFAQWTLELFLALFVVVGHFILGFIDDYIKVVKKQNLGLKARQKFLGQLIIAVLVAVYGGLQNDLWIPFCENIDLGFLFYFLLVFVMVGTTNAVNLTDGLDGLASGTVAVAAFFYMLVCAAMGKPELAVLSAATVGACLGFLKFNYHPAKIFMGDTGSLALGGVMAAVGILTHTEILLAVIGFVFVCEALSVIIQVISFQSTGKRVFLMSPVHHHFELKGWSETKVVWVFWTVGFIAGVAGLALFVLGA
ncbi:MAG: phospho-N-acetylmuramoyl-pentapeptide-transferase [Anaerovibrio sp.]|uniref:phospho-N-acetylmuramoyl-pentapeptide- transferase n=1 Tax=Anaerovibrio sp. TaxID=1872532 RepID=UPI0025DB14A3|nr:phospho-N-acetylmuramoyl-pentapeptide-transferase [Anaerovibrio sp.]MCR5175399.1 phospho-N-acetylmuramoyl-pentapeptide-transferase [Anaerovibrio sp.]